MPQKPVYLTPEGLAKLQEELNHLRNVRRPEVVARIHQAKEFSGPTDNAEYEDAKNEQAFVEGRILTLEEIIRTATIIDTKDLPTDTVKLGSHVTVRTQEGEEEYTIVGSAEANPKEGKISNESPVGQALLGRQVGEELQVLVPAGVVKLTVLAIH